MRNVNSKSSKTIENDARTRATTSRFEYLESGFEAHLVSEVEADDAAGADISGVLLSADERRELQLRIKRIYLRLFGRKGMII